MSKSQKIEKRKLQPDEIKRVRIDLATRGWLSLLSALMVVIYAIILTSHGIPIFADRGITGLCVAAIWIAVIAVDFGLVRSGLQFLTWRKGNHMGVLKGGDVSSPNIFDDLVNFAICIVFVAFGITVLITGKLGLGDIKTIPQIPLSILSIAFGLTSGETAAIHFWFRRRGLVDVLHKIDDNTETGES